MTMRKKVEIYIKGDYTKEIPFDYLKLSKENVVWGKDGIEP